MARTPKPNYKAFAKGLMALCAKHGVRISACDEGIVCIAGAKNSYADDGFDELIASPIEVTLGNEWCHKHNQTPYIQIKRDS